MFYAKELNNWPTESGKFSTIEEAIEWGKSNLKGEWAVYKKGLLLDDEIRIFVS